MHSICGAWEPPLGGRTVAKLRRDVVGQPAVAESDADDDDDEDVKEASLEEDALANSKEKTSLLGIVKGERFGGWGRHLKRRRKALTKSWRIQCTL